MRNYVIILILALFMCSCLETPEVELTKRDLDLIDSLYSLNRDSMKALSDSICTVEREKLYQHLVDSMVQERQAYINSILER